MGLAVPSILSDINRDGDEGLRRDARGEACDAGELTWGGPMTISDRWEGRSGVEAPIPKKEGCCRGFISPPRHCIESRHIAVGRLNAVHMC